MSKIELYQQLKLQVSALISTEHDMVANMANISALLFEYLPDVNWVGFYRSIEDELVLGPFQGKVACIRIPLGKGVCGTAASEGKTQRIADVHQFSGHIACDAASNSEIVIPVYHQEKVIAVLDIDSPINDRFDVEDQQGLESLVKVFEQTLYLEQQAL
ncbi:MULTISPECIES: GAF domain-containing protein [Thalassotalea]|uniref:GAF domain-containing protein n=1 Tax=Thalassotalea TaxID=1518149 RepID=UPI0009440CA7|nr:MULTISPECIES: GAF domain-containing protein [Thalassotalea]OKY25462.1 hypothetical protein BI291_16470 [Thalassotalea sp. PP2-459]